MKLSHPFISAAGLIASAVAVSPRIGHNITTSRVCQDLIIPVTLSARNLDLPNSAPKNDVDVTNLVLNTYSLSASLSSSLSNTSSNPSPSLKFANVSGNYQIGATYCEPLSARNTGNEAGARRPTLQILTHGVGFDRRYWDFPYRHHNYSYVAYAVDRGYATLAWDRLGIAASRTGNEDPVAELQAPLQIAALAELTSLARRGELPLQPQHVDESTESRSSSSKSRAQPRVFDKVVHVGHSYGSILTYGLAAHSTFTTTNTTAASNPITDGIILTGFAHGSAAQTLLAPAALHLADVGSVAPVRRKGLYPPGAGWLAEGDRAGAQMTLFAPGQFDRGEEEGETGGGGGESGSMLDAVFEASQAIPVGEFLTLGLPVGLAPRIEGFEEPVLVVAGERDLGNCGGDCYAVPESGSEGYRSLVEMASEYFPSTRVFEGLVVQGAGHALNLEYSWPVSYNKITEFMAQHGLGP